MVFQLPRELSELRPPAVVPPKYWVYVDPLRRAILVNVLEPRCFENATRIPVLPFSELSVANALKKDVETQGMVFQVRQNQCGHLGIFPAFRPSDDVRHLVEGHMDEDGEYCSLGAPWPPVTRLLASYLDYESAEAVLQTLVTE